MVFISLFFLLLRYVLSYPYPLILNPNSTTLQYPFYMQIGNNKIILTSETPFYIKYNEDNSSYYLEIASEYNSAMFKADRSIGNYYKFNTDNENLTMYLIPAIKLKTVYIAYSSSENTTLFIEKEVDAPTSSSRMSDVLLSNTNQVFASQVNTMNIITAEFISQYDDDITTIIFDEDMKKIQPDN